MDKTITQKEFDNWVERVHDANTTLAATRNALRELLDDLDVDIKEPWEDGDLVKSPFVEVFYLRRKGRWFEIPNAGAMGRTYDDAAMDMYVERGTLVEVTDFGAQPEGDDDE